MKGFEFPTASRETPFKFSISLIYGIRIFMKTWTFESYSVQSNEKLIHNEGSWYIRKGKGEKRERGKGRSTLSLNIFFLFYIQKGRDEE